MGITRNTSHVHLLEKPQTLSNHRLSVASLIDLHLFETFLISLAVLPPITPGNCPLTQAAFCTVFLI